MQKKDSYKCHITFHLNLLLVIVSIFFFSCTEPNSEQITIGAILPLTGDGAQYGVQDQRGIDLALSEVDSLDIRVIYEDNAGTANGSVSAFQKLVNTHNVPAVIGLMFSSSAQAVAPLGESNQVVILSTTASNPDLTNAGDYFFRNWPSDIYEGEKMAEFAFNELNLRRISILGVNLDYGIGLIDVFRQRFEELGGQVTLVETYEEDDSNFRSQLNKIKNSNPDAIYLPGYYSEIGIILRQAKELNINTQFLSSVGFDDPEIFDIAGEAANGVVFARPYYNPESNDSLTTSFVSKYENRYGEKPGIYAAHAYDAMKILSHVIKQYGSAADSIKKGLNLIENFEGVTGITSFDENGDVVKPIQVMKVENMKFLEYGKKEKVSN